MPNILGEQCRLRQQVIFAFSGQVIFTTDFHCRINRDFDVDVSVTGNTKQLPFNSFFQISSLSILGNVLILVFLH